MDALGWWRVAVILLCLVNIGYVFKAQLLELERVSQRGQRWCLPGAVDVVTSLQAQVWEQALLVHPDRQWAGVFVEGHPAGLPDWVLHRVCSFEWMCTEHPVGTGTSGSGAGLPGQGGQRR